jgi:hypothetical protein
MRCGLPPPAAPPYKISVALLRSATSCFGCGRNVIVFLLLTSAAALNEDLWLEVHAALHIVLDAVAVDLGRELANVPSIGIEL